jgi:hypothetical protein
MTISLAFLAPDLVKAAIDGGSHTAWVLPASPTYLPNGQGSARCSAFRRTDSAFEPSLRCSPNRRRGGSWRTLRNCLAKKTTGPPSSAPGGPFVADVWLELLLFCGFALHVKVISAPGLTTLHAAGAPCLTPLVATRTSRFTPLVATCAPLLTPFHTGRCWSGGCWSDWLCLSFSI